MILPFLIQIPPSSLELILSDTHLTGASISASVTTLDGTVVFEHDPGLHVTPASNQKLLTAAFALHQLGPAYRPITRFWRRGAAVYVDSPGDPSMRVDQLEAMKRMLKLPANATARVRQAYWPGVPEGWEYDDLPNKYAAPVAAFTVNLASFELHAIGGRPVAIPSAFGTRIKFDRSSAPPTWIYDPILGSLYVTGTLPKVDTVLDTLSVFRPDQAAAHILAKRFVAWSMMPKTTPDGTISGRSVAELIGDCLPRSDNQIAEHLLMMASTRQAPQKNPYPKAQAGLQTFMEQRVGTIPGDVHPSDGSGLSRHNFVTARAMTALLRWADQQPTRSIWRNALVTPGKGTLKARLDGVPFQGKTGTLDMVVAISGYVRHSTGQDLAVSLIINLHGGTTKDARDVADRFIAETAHADLASIH